MPLQVQISSLARFSQNNTRVSKTLRDSSRNNIDCRVCAPEGGVENSAGTVLVPMEEKADTESRAAGATGKQVERDAKGKIIEFIWHLKREGYSEDTIKTYAGIMKRLISLGADIFNPEDVKTVIAKKRAEWSEGRWQNVIKAYSAFLKMSGCSWSKPRTRFKRGLPRPPTPDQVKQLIAGASRKYATVFKFLAETGCSPIEAACLTERDFDFERGVVYVKGRKGHLDRVIPMSPELTLLMKEFFAKYGAFPRADQMGRKWRKYRDRTAEKLKDPSLKRIRLYDLRHYYGTMLYAQTRDILYVKDKMGHSKIETTMTYTKLIALPTDEEYICRAAETVEEAKELIEAGFEYVCDINNIKLFRKRKILVDLKGPWSM